MFLFFFSHVHPCIGFTWSLTLPCYYYHGLTSPPVPPFSTPKYSEDGPSVPVSEEMSLGRLLRRASSKASDLLTFNPGAGGSSLRPGLDGEIIFSKNNVCVHPAEPLPGLAEHHPGKAGLMLKVSFWLYICVV